MATLDYLNLISTVEKIADKYDKMSISQVLFSVEKSRLPKSSSDRNIVEGYREPANRKFLNLNAKLIIDSECVVDGVLLVSPYCIMFSHAVVHLVENDPNKFSTVAFSDVILSVALYKQLPNLNVSTKDKDGDCYSGGKNAQHNHAEVYRGESIDIKTSTKIPMSCDDAMPSYCLCLKVLSSEACRAKEFVNCNSLKLPDGEFGDKSRGEFWYSISDSDVDILYKFCVRYMPKKYANYEASEIFSDVQAPNVHANPKALTDNETFTTSSDNISIFEELINALPNCALEIALVWYEKLNGMKRKPDELGKETETLAAQICEMMKNAFVENSSYEEIINSLCPNDKMEIVKKIVDSLSEAISEKIREIMKQFDCSKNPSALLPDLLENEPVQEAKDKKGLMRESKKKKISKLIGGVVKVEDIVGFPGQKSIDDILAFIEGGSAKMKNSLKKEKNNSPKKNKTKRYFGNNFNDKSVKKTENESEILVDGGEISKNINFLSNDVSGLENSDKPENEECLADFVPVSRNRLLKNILVARSTCVKEAKPVIRSENYKIPIASSVKLENSKEKSEKRKQKLKINPYSWPLILLKPENHRFDESESGKVVTHENVKVTTNSGNFSSNEILNKKKHENASSSNESHQNGPCLQRQIIKPPSN